MNDNVIRMAQEAYALHALCLRNGSFKSLDGHMTQDIIRTNPPINAMDFGVPPSFAECAENYARWAVEAEKEAAAKMVDDWDSDSADPRDIAAAIRARGNT